MQEKTFEIMKNYKKMKWIKNINNFFYEIQKVIYVLIGKLNKIHKFINEISIQEISRFFQISRDTSRTKIEPGSRKLNPSEFPQHDREVTLGCLLFYLYGQ